MTWLVHRPDGITDLLGRLPLAHRPVCARLTRRTGPARRAVVAAIAITVFAPGAARADGSADAARIAYHARGDGCPTAALFREQVVSRSPDTKLMLAVGTEAPDYVVELFGDRESLRISAPPPDEPDASQADAAPLRSSSVGVGDGNDVMGRVDAYHDGARSLLKELRGATCSEVASALALVLSLAIERRREAPSTLEPPVAPPEHRAAPPGGPAPTATGRSRWRPAVGMATSLATGYLRNPLFGGAVFLEFEHPWVAPLAFVVRLSALHQKGRMGEEWGSVEVALTAGVVDLCPLRILLLPYAAEGRGAELAACAGATLGQLATSGNITGGRSGDDSAFYQDVRASLRPRLVVSQHFGADLEVGVRASWQRYALQIRGVDHPVYESQVGMSASAGITYVFR